MAEHDEKGRPQSPRERARLRATFGSDPGSGYAFHDEERVERRKPSSPERSGTAEHSARSEWSATPARSAVPDWNATPAWSPTPERVSSKPPRKLPSSYPTLRGAPAANEPGHTPPPLSMAPPKIIEVRPAGIDAAGEPHARDAAVPEESHIRDKPWIDPEALKSAARTAPNTEEPTVPIRTRPSREEMPTGRHNVSLDARIARLEPMVARSAWDHVLVELTHERELAPALLLLRLIARREIEPNSDANQRQESAAEATHAMASLLGIPATSPVALLLAKRLLRRNPRNLRQQDATTGIVFLLLTLGVFFGIGAGFLATHFLL